MGAMFYLPFTKAARQRKADKAALTAARTFVHSYDDLAEYREGGAHGREMAALRAAAEAGRAAECRELLDALDKPQSFAVCREWLDILVVSISVAMAFRAYFYQPFNIPTGSMQPTLYGNHSEACAPEDATFWDRGPQKWLKWALTGAMFEHYRAPFGGRLQFRPTNTGYYSMHVVQPGTGKASKGMLVPTDVLHPRETGDGPYRGTVLELPNGLRPGMEVEKGRSLWSGYVVTGDFLFVNRWLWNFRHPRRGDVMVFSTTGIEGLQQGTHYIKRMTGTPGEELGIQAPRLIVNGVAVEEPRRIGQIARREKFCEEAYPYAGFAVSGMEGTQYDVPGKTLARENDRVKLGEAEYYACGDNSPSSYDSRYWGPVPAANLRGIAGGVFWPIVNHRWGGIE